jgi:hypothetical protein
VGLNLNHRRHFCRTWVLFVNTWQVSCYSVISFCAYVDTWKTECKRTTEDREHREDCSIFNGQMLLLNFRVPRHQNHELTEFGLNRISDRDSGYTGRDLSVKIN